MMKTLISSLALSLVLLAAPAQAQHHHSHASSSPYAGFEKRSIKSLSEQQIADLRAGRGMGLALPAEMNGYPGPIHVIELQERLGLSDTQLVRMRELLDAMKLETIPLGERLIEQEAELDRQFADKTVTLASLTSATQGIGTTQAALRAAHLKYHLAAVEVLTPEQVSLYRQLRGYGGP